MPRGNPASRGARAGKRGGNDRGRRRAAQPGRQTDRTARTTENRRYGIFALLRPPVDIRGTLPLLGIAAALAFVSMVLIGNRETGDYAIVAVLATGVVARAYGLLYVHHARGPGSRGRQVTAIMLGGMVAALLVPAIAGGDRTATIVGSAVVIVVMTAALEALRRATGVPGRLRG